LYTDSKVITTRDWSSGYGDRVNLPDAVSSQLKFRNHIKFKDFLLPVQNGADIASEFHHISRNEHEPWMKNHLNGQMTIQQTL
jgi:hypothetical protein